MPRLIRYSLIACAAVLLAATAAVLAFNIHLQSPAMQERLRQAAMESIGLPLSVRSVLYTPWSGIRLQGLVIPDMENAGVNFLEASEFQISFRLLPLLRREFVVSRLTLRDAILTWRQNAQGQWRVPRDPAHAVARAADAPATPQPTPAPDASPAATSMPSEPAFDVSVEGLEVRRSRILFENRDRWPLLDADGISARAQLDGRGDASGEAKVPEAVVAGLLVARDLASSFTLEGGVLSLPDIRAHVAGGALTGHGTIATREEGSPYEWSLALAGFKLQELRLSPKLGGTRFEGVLSANLDLAGRNSPQRRLRGTGRIEIAGGKLIPSSYLQEIGRILDIRELRGMTLSEARADLRVEDDLVYVEPLWLRADEIAIEIRGTVARGGQLDLNGRLLLAPGVAKSVASRTGRDLAPADHPALPGYRAMPFHVGGTIQEPDSDLTSRLLGGGVGGQIGKFLLNLIGAP